MHHRRLVSAFWLVMFVAGMFSASQLSDRLSLDFSLPGQPGDTAEAQMMETFGTSSFDTYIAVVTVPAGETVLGNQEEVAQVFDSVRESLPVVRVVDYQSTHDDGF